MHVEKLTSRRYQQLCFSTISTCVIAVTFSPQKLWDDHYTRLFSSAANSWPYCEAIIRGQLLAKSVQYFFPSGHFQPTHMNKDLENKHFL